MNLTLGRPHQSARSTFALAAVAVGITVLVFAAWLALRIGGDRVTTAVDDIGEALAALIAAASCAGAARRSTGQLRVAWILIAASALSWGLGEAVWSVYEVGLGVSVPFPSTADVGFLAAIPLAIGGVLAFFSPPRGTSTSVRLWVDGLIVGLSLTFVGWALGLNRVYQEAGDQMLVRLISLAYPFGDILIGTVLVLAIRRATAEAHGRLLLLLAGLAANAMADSAFAYLTTNGVYGAVGSVLDTGWVVGYLLIALAALWPSAPINRPAAESPIDIWQVALPWLAVLGAGLSAVALVLRGQQLDEFLTVVAGLLAVCLMISQVFAHVESRALLIRARLAAATINDVIVHAPLGVIRLDRNLNVLQANPGFVALLLAQPADVVGAPIGRHLPADEVAHMAEMLSTLASRPTSVEGVSRASRRDSSKVWLHWSATAVRRADGSIDYFIAMFEDITSKHQAEAAASANLSLLERLNRLKSEFLTMVSHEFRTRLVGIQGFSELMRDAESLDMSEVRNFASEVYNDARRLDQMLDKMLEIDRDASSQALLAIGELNLNNAIHDVVATALAERQSLNLVTDLEPQLPMVRGDAGKLAQLLGILMGNAIKYSPNGSEVAVASRSGPGYVEISVRDRGPGMPADFDPRLFTGQPKATNPTSRVVGSGLGLPIAREIVELHGGRIWFDSAPGVGTEFHVTIPSSGKHPLDARPSSMGGIAG